MNLISRKNIFNFFLCLLVFTTAVNAQEGNNPDQVTDVKDMGRAKFIISGTLYQDGLRLENVTCLIKLDGDVILEERSDGAGKFKVTVELDKILTLHFVKDDLVEKTLELDTRNVPVDNRKFDFFFKSMKVDLYPSDLEVDFSSLKKPVAILVYNPTEDQFSTDKKYARSVKPSRDRLVKAVYDAYNQRDDEINEAFDDYMLAVKDGDLFLKEGEYEAALDQYEAAKEIMPNELYPDKQISKTMAIMEANKSVDAQYATLIERADDAFDDKDWEAAKLDYEEALEVKPKYEYPTDQLASIEKNIKDEALLLAQQEETERVEMYDALVSSADSLLGLKKYNASLAKYSDALEVIPKDYPKTKIKEINGVLARNQKANAAYDALMVNANKNLASKNYVKAKEYYTSAQELKPEEALPKSKIIEIETAIAGLVALEAQELALNAQKEADLKALYDAVIIRADALLVDKSYTEAKAKYEEALGLKPKQEYPTDQIKGINTSLAKIEGVDKQYDKLMADGVKNKSVQKLALAKSDFQAASDLKPAEQAPKDAIADIDAKLATIAAGVIAKQKAKDDRYDNFVAAGDAMLALDKLTEAQVAYREALSVKSKEQYPQTQITIIDERLQVLAVAAAASEKEALALAAKETKYKQTIGKADQLMKTGDLTGAKTEYKLALTIFEGKTYPTGKISEIDNRLDELAAVSLAKKKAQEAIDAKQLLYQTAVKKADVAFAQKDYTQAKLAYQEAQGVDNTQVYPAKQLEKIDGLELAEKQKLANAALLAEQQAANKQKFDAVVAEGDALVAKGELQKGKYKYESALKLVAGNASVVTKMRDVTNRLEEARKLSEFQAKNDTEFNRQLAEKYPDGLNETIKKGGKTTTRIVIVSNGRGDEYRKEVYSYGAVFYFKNGKSVNETTYKRETKGH